MILQQLSVFLENKSGRLTEVLETLGQEQIKITALTVADTSEFGILRLIVSDSERARKILHDRSFTVNLTEVISLVTPSETSHLARIMHILSDLDISIKYTYAFSTGEKSVLILRCSNPEEAIRALKEHEPDLMKASAFFTI